MRFKRKKDSRLAHTPRHEVLFPEYWKALDQPFPTGPEAMQTLREHIDIVRRSV